MLDKPVIQDAEFRLISLALSPKSFAHYTTLSTLLDAQIGRTTSSAYGVLCQTIPLTSVLQFGGLGYYKMSLKWASVLFFAPSQTSPWGNSSALYPKHL